MQHAAVIASRMDEGSKIRVFFCRHILGLVLVDDERRLFFKFMKIKSPILQGAKSDDAFKFLTDFDELLPKMVVIEKYVHILCHLNCR